MSGLPVCLSPHDFSQPVICLHLSSSCRAPFGPFDVTKCAVADFFDIRFSASPCYSMSVFATEQSVCLCRVLDVLSFPFKLQLTIKLRDFFRLPQRCNWGLFPVCDAPSLGNGFRTFRYDVVVSSC
jgi:hypothetical protein